MAYCFTVRTLPAALGLWPVSVGTDTQELQVFPPLCSPCRGADTLSSACHTVSAGHAPAEGPPEPTTPTAPLTHGVTLLFRRPPWGHGEGRWAHGRCRTHRGHWRTCSCCVVCPCRTAPQEGSLGQALPSRPMAGVQCPCSFGQQSLGGFGATLPWKTGLSTRFCVPL